MESQLIGSALPFQPGNSTTSNQIANAALIGALVMHVFAAIMSFLSAFFLIRYKLAMAKMESKNRDVESGKPASEGAQKSAPTMDPGIPTIFSADPHLEQVGPFRRGQPPTHLLDHCHTLCMWLTAMGFVLAMVGVVYFAWTRLARSGGIFAAGCMFVCLAMSVVAFLWPASSAHRRK